MRTRLLTLRAGGWALTVALAVSLGAPNALHAGGPLAVGGPTFGINGQAFTWSTAAAISYRTDDGPLANGTRVINEAAARTRVEAMFQVWQDVTTSNISFSRAGFISAVGAYTGGDVNNLAEFDAVEGDCNNGNQSPIIYDADAVIFIDLGVDETSVIGFAGPCAITGGGAIVSGEAVMNGLFQDGDPSPTDISDASFDAALIHEFGHFSGLDHSQINVNCLGGCPADDLLGLPTMFPILVSSTMGSLGPDDIAWISRLYPETVNDAPNGRVPFTTTHGTITGTVFFTDGASQAQGVNVIARQVDTGANEDRKVAVSVVSGFRFTSNPGQSVTGTNTGGSDFGSRDPLLIGRFEIPVPAGNYTIEVESINATFDAGSSVGPLDPPIPMPGTAPAALGPIAVAAGATVAGNDVTLVGTDPRFDSFESSP